MRFSRKKEEGAGIPTGSMADIAFLLILFFMVTTVFRAEVGLKVALPQAEQGNKIANKNIIHIYIAGEAISIDDIPLQVSQVSGIMSSKMQVEPSAIVSLQIDKDVKYDIVGDVFDALSEARALRISLATEKLKG